MPLLSPTTLGKFCREIAGGLSPLDVLLREWGLSSDEYARLRESPGYKHEMQVIVQEMQELGPDAGYIYRMKALSEEFIADIVNIMRDPGTGPGTKVELIKFCADLARLKEKPTPAGQQNALPRGPSVVFNFGPGLPITSMKLIPDEGIQENNDVHRNSADESGQLPLQAEKSIQGPRQAVGQMGGSRAAGFQYDLSTDAG